MRILDIMTTDVASVSPTTPLSSIWELIVQKKINAVPVISSDKKLAGIITKEDILKVLYPDYIDLVADFSQASDYEEMEGKVKANKDRTAQEIMCPRVVFTRTHTPAMRALSRMIAQRVNQLPVLDDADAVVGLVTKGDIFYALFGKTTRFVGSKAALE